MGLQTTTSHLTQITDAAFDSMVRVASHRKNWKREITCKVGGKTYHFDLNQEFIGAERKAFIVIAAQNGKCTP